MNRDTATGHVTSVGGKFVQYTAHLYSAALGPPVILHSFLYFIIIFGPRNPWESRAIYNSSQILENQRILNIYSHSKWGHNTGAE